MRFYLQLLEKITGFYLSPKLLQFILFLTIGHAFVWTQCNGQLIWKPFKDNIWAVCLMGFPLSYLFVRATRIGYDIFDEKLWAVKLIGFSVGTIVFFIMTLIFLGESITLKTFVSLLLCVAIILVQITL